MTMTQTNFSLPATMKALVRPNREPGVLEVNRLSVPTPGAGQILARVAYGGICGSDLDILYDRTKIYQPPVVPGHEFVAVVAQPGANVTDFAPGDKVVSETVLAHCGGCQACELGDYHLCLQKRILGWNENGGYGQYILLNSRFTHKLPPQTNLKAAALAEPTAIAAEAVYVKGQLQPGQSVVVIGPGPTGLLSAVVARQLGANPVILVGRASAKAYRFPAAYDMGIEHCVDSSVTNPVAYLQKCNGGRLADLVIDSTGTPEGFLTGLELVRRNGRLVELGSITTDTLFPWDKVAWKALDLRFVFSSSGAAWRQVAALYEGGFNPSRMVTGVFPIEEYKDAFDTAAHAAHGLKTLFEL
jgi:L-iditol 2-dehydrogenase